MRRMRIVSWNLWGTGYAWSYEPVQGVTPAAATAPAPSRDEFAAIRKQLVIRELQAAAADLVMLQEVVHDDARSLADALCSRAVQAVVTTNRDSAPCSLIGGGKLPGRR